LIPDIKGHVHKKFKDPFLEVRGPAGIKGRSIVIHKPGLAKTRIDCADIKIVHDHDHKKRRLPQLY
jgi:hypothetical protein